MGVPVIPPTNAAIRSMVRLPDSGWDTSLPPSVLDLSRSSSLAAAVQVQVGRFPFITRNTLGASVSAAATSTTSAKLCEPDPHRQSREERTEENSEARSERLPVKKVLKGKARPVARKSVGESSGGSGSTLHATKTIKTAKRIRQPSPEASSIKRIKSHRPSMNTQQGPSQVLSNGKVYMIPVNTTASGTVVLQGGPGTSVLLLNGESGSQQNHQGVVMGLQREAQELRAVNNHLKQRLINYQNIFKDKQKLRKVVNILCNNNPPPVQCA